MLKKREVFKDRDNEWKCELPELLLLNPGTNFFILSNVDFFLFYHRTYKLKLMR